MTEPLNGAELLARIRPVLREESTEVCLRSDLVDAFIAAEAELVESQAADTGGRMSDGVSAKTKKLARKVQDLEQQIGEHSITFRFRALPKSKWSALCDEHPPRAKNQLDMYAGYDRDAVLDDAVRKCLIDPVFDDKSWAELLEVLPVGEWAELTSTVNSVNREVVDAPKSVLASRILDRHASTSK